MTILTMPVTEARVNFGSVVEKVRSRSARIVLEKSGIPVATIINIEELEDLYDTIALMQAREESKNEPTVKWGDIRKKYA